MHYVKTPKFVKAILLSAAVTVTLPACNMQKEEKTEVVTDIKQLSKEPQFAGDVYEYMAMHTVYPQSAADGKMQGNVMVSFVIDENGKITDVKPTAGKEPLVQAALDCMAGMPAWTPAEKDGKKVATRWVLPFTFRMEANKGAKVTDLSHLTDDEFNAELAKMKEEMAMMREKAKAERGDVKEADEMSEQQVKAELTAILSQGVEGKTRSYITPGSALKS